MKAKLQTAVIGLFAAMSLGETALSGEIHLLCSVRSKLLLHEIEAVFNDEGKALVLIIEDGGRRTIEIKSEMRDAVRISVSNRKGGFIVAAEDRSNDSRWELINKLERSDLPISSTSHVLIDRTTGTLRATVDQKLGANSSSSHEIWGPCKKVGLKENVF